MASSGRFSSPLNTDLVEKKTLISLVERDDLHNLLKDFNFNWDTDTYNPDSEISKIFNQFNWIENGCRLNRLGKLVYGRLALHFDDIGENGKKEVGNFQLVERLRSGKNSVVFLAKHRVLGSQVVLKFIRPGASNNLRESLRKLSNADFGETIVMPTDIFEVEVTDLCDRPVRVDCLVFPYIAGQTFDAFLHATSNHFNAHIVISFIRQVGNALLELEKIGAYHGDLHDHNILVTSSSNDVIEFKLLDISFDAVGSMSLDDSIDSDIENFKQHIWKILSAQKKCVPHASLRKFVGTRSYLKITEILAPECRSFTQIMRILEDDTSYSRYSETKKKFISEQFAEPKSFRLQRYEEFTDPAVAARLFVPFPEVREKINEFGNVYVSGNRGSGKSTYLASLAYYPSIDKPISDPKDRFGIYFPCRQGEFKAITLPPDMEDNQRGPLLLHIIILKIIRRTLQVLSESIFLGKTEPQKDYSQLKDHLNNIVPQPGIVSVERSLVSEFDNFVSTILRVELDEIKSLAQIKQAHKPILSAPDLISFFNTLRATFGEFGSTQFYILFDDAGTPYVQDGVQSAINELLITSNPVFCIKLSAEKNTYSFKTFDGKILENGHDYYEQDISYNLFIGSGKHGVRTDQLENYFRQIVNQRLKLFNYKSHDIRDYLGDNSDAVRSLTASLAQRREHTYYCGWTTVWNVADRTPRNLLELVSEIFSVGNIDTDSVPRNVSMRSQNRAITTISEKRLQSLSQIAGSITIGGKKFSLGRKLFEVTITVGSVFRTYLRQEYNKKEIRQHLAIERNDLSDISIEAQLILDRLVTYGVLDSSRSGFARDDQVRKPFYVLNRIFCPAFRIGYQRDEHLKLSAGKLEQLLLFPQHFLKGGTRRLTQASGGKNVQVEMFGYRLDGSSDE